MNYTSLGKYILDYKMNLACEKLEKTDLAIKEIAILTGFVDQNYFSRVFKKEKGITPQQYRNMKFEDFASRDSSSV